MDNQATKSATDSRLATVSSELHRKLVAFGEYADPIKKQLAFLATIGDLSNEKYRMMITLAMRWNPDQYLAMNPESMETIVSHADKFTSIRNIARVWGMDAWSIFVVRMMHEVSQMVQVKNGLTEKVMESLPVQFANDRECSQLTIPDLILCMKMGVRGKFGDDFNRLDVPTVFRWINAYYAQRKDITKYSMRPIEQIHAEREKKNADAVERSFATIRAAKASNDYSTIMAYHFDFLVKYCGAELTEAMVNERCQDEMLQEFVRVKIENELSPMDAKAALRDIAGYNETRWMAKKDLAVEWIKENDLKR